MLILAGTITVEPSDRARMMELVAPMIAASQAEPGCHAYQFSVDPFDDSIVHLFELWADQAALDLHGASEHMASWKAAAADIEITGRQLTKYTVSDSMPHS